MTDTDTDMGRSAEEQNVLDAAYARMMAEQRERELRATEIDSEQVRAANAAALEHLDPACVLAQDLAEHNTALEQELPALATALTEAAEAIAAAVAEHDTAIAAHEATLPVEPADDAMPHA